MNLTFLYLVAALFFLLAMAPQSRRTYQRCFWPIFRPPRAEFAPNLFLLLTVTTGVLFFYGGSVGAAVYLVTPSGDVKGEDLQAGALAGAFAFAAARLLAMTESQGLAKSIYTTGVLVAAGFLALGLMRGDSWTETTDHILKLDQDDLRFLSICGGLALAVAAVPEALIAISDRMLSDSAPMPFNLVREHLEALEGYPRISGEQQILRRIKKELGAARIPAGRPLEVLWLSANADTGIRDVIRDAERLAQGTQGLAVRVLTHESQESRDNLAVTPTWACRYVRHGGTFRMFIVDHHAAILGVQLGRNRQRHYPDYAIVIDDPVRIAWLTGLFEATWNIAP